MVSSEPARREGAAATPSHLELGSEQGFTIVEVIIAVMILAVGLLGMAGTTLLVVQQTAMAEATADRSTAIQTTIEHLRAMPFDDVAEGSDSVGVFDVTWSVANSDRWKDVEIVTVGPGATTSRGFPMLALSVHDTFSYRVLRQ